MRRHARPGRAGLVAGRRPEHVAHPRDVLPASPPGELGGGERPSRRRRCSPAVRDLNRVGRARPQAATLALGSVASVTSAWPALPYERWSATCDTLHAHTQVLGKLAVALAPREPQLQHAALHLSARGWETRPLPAPDGSGAFVVGLDLRSHEAVVEHTDGRLHRIPLAPDRPVADVTREVLAAVERLAGPVRIDPRPQEVPWTTPLDEDHDHATYDPAHASAYFAAATQGRWCLPRCVPRTGVDRRPSTHGGARLT